MADGSVWLDHQLDQIVEDPASERPTAGDAIRRNTEARYLTSASTVARVVDQLGLADVRGIGQPLYGKIVPHALARARAITNISGELEVQAVGTSYAVTARYRAVDPVLATGILNQLLDQYVEARRDTARRDRTLAKLHEQRDLARDEMIRASAAADAYRAAMIPPFDDASARIAARGRESSNRAQAAELGGTTSPSPQMLALTAQLVDLEAERRRLAQVYGPRHPDMIDINERLAVLHRDVDQQTSIRGQRKRGRPLDLASGRGRQIRNLVGGQIAVQSARLDRKAVDARTRLKALDTALRQREVRHLSTRSGAYVISHALVPTRPAFPRWWMFVLGALIAALSISALVIAVRELLTPGFRSRRAAERRLALPVIGLVPNTHTLFARYDSGGDPPDPIDFILSREPSSFKTAFARIQSWLRTEQDESARRTLAICSAVAAEGKTTVAVCLARAAAVTGQRVLLIDCDTRRPAASQALAPRRAFGLTDVLRGDVTPERAFEIDVPSGAFVLAATGPDGDLDDAPLDLDAMKALVAQLRGSFDLVILDTPPILALAEARGLACMADRLLLVARWRSTPVRAVELALASLRQVGADVAGLALTLVED